MKRLTTFIVLGLVAGVLFLAPVTAQAGFGIDPGKVYIDNLHPGAEADFPITVYNQNDHEATFRVAARQPDYTAEGYEALPHLDWVTVTPDRVTIGARGQSDVLVVIVMPEDTRYSGKKAEVWVSFMEQGAEGMIRIEICSRLFVSTRVEATDVTSVGGGGAVGITAEAAGRGPAPPLSPWVIAGSVLGVVLAGGAVFSLVRGRRRV